MYAVNFFKGEENGNYSFQKNRGCHKKYDKSICLQEKDK